MHLKSDVDREAPQTRLNDPKQTPVEITVHLYIGNKLYSSWSLRAWILMRAFDLTFQETVIPLDEADTAANIRALSPAGKVPFLVDDGHLIWDTSAIAEYLHEKFPDKQIWPRNDKARAHARSISAEMHSGYMALRSACPMNLGKRYSRRDRGADVAADVSRIESNWNDARLQYGSASGGAFLYGDFSAADAMYAPVVTRLDTYDFPVNEQSRAYMDAILHHPAYVEWRDAALQETWIIAADEVDEPAIKNFRPHLD